MLPQPPTLIASALADTSVWSHAEKVGAVVGPLTALAVGFLVNRLVRRTPWPRPFRFRFALFHAAAAITAAFAWWATSSAIESLLSDARFLGQYGSERLFIGSIGYVLVAGVSYASQATARAARAEAEAARAQLAALRGQLHPHFLFNALHTVVQLIPVEPARAAEAAELVADLLRTTVEEQRDEVRLGDEWSFVSRYLAIERIRFGDRLVVRADIDDTLLDVRVPAFALQTLVENAVRHGAAHRVEPTEIAVTAAGSPSELTLTVRNAVNAAAAHAGTGTGLSRLRERLGVLYGGAARLVSGPADGAFEAVLVLPRQRATRA